MNVTNICFKWKPMDSRFKLCNVYIIGSFKGITQSKSAIMIIEDLVSYIKHFSYVNPLETIIEHNYLQLPIFKCIYFTQMKVRSFYAQNKM